jgi:pyridoxal/pyridoxine/pyridoxamine kinase
VITQQPSEQIKAPTAQIESAKEKIDETVTTTTKVEEEEQPTVQVSSSVTQPKQTVQVIIRVKFFQKKKIKFS